MAENDLRLLTISLIPRKPIIEREGRLAAWPLDTHEPHCTAQAQLSVIQLLIFLNHLFLPYTLKSDYTAFIEALHCLHAWSRPIGCGPWLAWGVCRGSAGCASECVAPVHAWHPGGVVVCARRVAAGPQSRKGHVTESFHPNHRHSLFDLRQ